MDTESYVLPVQTESYAHIYNGMRCVVTGDPGMNGWIPILREDGRSFWIDPRAINEVVIAATAPLPTPRKVAGIQLDIFDQLL